MQSKGGRAGRIGIAGGRSRAHRPMSEINVTPFVDVMLVLLIVFMVTAPLLTAGVKIDLPDSQAKAVSEEDNRPLEISLTAQGDIFIGETQVDGDRLINMLQAMTRDDSDRRIFIKADQSLNYGDVMQVLGMLNASGFNRVALLSEPGR